MPKEKQTKRTPLAQARKTYNELTGYTVDQYEEFNKLLRRMVKSNATIQKDN